MQLIPRRVRTADRAGTEGGFTLLEVVIAMSLLAIVVVVASGSLWQVQRSEVYSRGRTAALDDMRSSLSRMTKDLRQTYEVNGTANADSLDVNTYIDGAPARVVYDMSGETLTRAVNGAPAVALLHGLTDGSTFTYTPDALAPEVVEIVLVVAPANLPATTLTLNAETTFRNR